MAGKIFIAKSIVTLGYFEFPTPFDHLFIVYDKDGNPFSTDNPLGGNPDEQVLIEGLPVGSPGTGYLGVIIDSLRDNARSLDTDIPLNGIADIDPYSVFHYTEISLDSIDLNRLLPDDLEKVQNGEIDLAKAVMNLLEAYAKSMGIFDSEIGIAYNTGSIYPLTGFGGANSNSVINTLINGSLVGLPPIN